MTVSAILMEQDAFKRRSSFWLLDTAQWLFENVQRFAEVDYEPTEEDIILTRQRTTGVTETNITTQDMSFQVRGLLFWLAASNSVWCRDGGRGLSSCSLH